MQCSQRIASCRRVSIFRSFVLGTMCLIVSVSLSGCQSGAVPASQMRSVPPGYSASGALPAIAPVNEPLGSYPAQTSNPPAGSDWNHVRSEPAKSVLSLPQTREAEARYHTIQSGENWSSIGRKYGLTVQQLTEANGLTSATPLQPGQSVFIPGN